jgi:hypothetical protein
MADVLTPKEICTATMMERTVGEELAQALSRTDGGQGMLGETCASVGKNEKMIRRAKKVAATTYCGLCLGTLSMPMTVAHTLPIHCSRDVENAGVLSVASSFRADQRRAASNHPTLLDQEDEQRRQRLTAL